MSKFCHIEDHNGQQVLFRIDKLVLWGDKYSVLVETTSPRGIVSKALYEGNFEECLEYFNTLYFNTLNFPEEAYKFLTEIASGVEFV